MNYKKEIWEFVKLIVVSLLIIIPVRFYIAQPFIVSGNSMDTSFLNGDYLIIDEISYQFKKPERGEVVVFRYPLDPSKFFIKRIIGLPGETVRIQNGVITIFNEKYPAGMNLDEDYAKGYTRFSATETLEEGKYFVLGDNREFSSDSRQWGSLPEKMLTGRALVRLWPLANLGLWPGINIGN
ncbi:MAG: signal peptidase I [Patescibacteria group bacterium]